MSAAHAPTRANLSAHQGLPEHEGLLDLLAESACAGLDEGARRQLADLIRSEMHAEPLDPEFPDAYAPDPADRGPAGLFDQTAASLALAMIARDGYEPLPAEAARSLRVAARAYAQAVIAPARGPLPFRPSESAAPATQAQLTDALRREGAIPMAAWAGWLAAAAAILFAVLVTAPRPELSPARRLAMLNAAVNNLVEAKWAGLAAIGLGDDHPLDNGIAGRVVWSDDRDEGYMEISGLAPNDPADFQYQLWIFDAQRPTGELPESYAALGLDILTQRPIDGGVFDFTPDPSGRAVVPVDAKLPVGKAAIFAVTKERPGGVVVSNRDIVFLAVPDAG